MEKPENFDYCHVAGLTDVGCVRKANEDSWATFESPNGLVTVVCDGMGGHVGGAIASSTAVEAIKTFLCCKYIDDARTAIGMAITEANKAIINRASEQPELNGMGSTCVLLIVRGGEVFIGHVGDSRIYIIRDNSIRQITKDHSYVQSLVDAGEITPEQAEHHPHKNEITNALGFAHMGVPTIAQEPIIPLAGDCFLLCSDGLSGMVEDKYILKVVSNRKNMRAQARAEKLVDEAKANGGKDNITVSIVEFSITPKRKKATDFKLAMLAKSKLYGLIIAALAILISMIFVILSPGDNINGKVESEELSKKVIKADTILFRAESIALDIKHNDKDSLVIVKYILPGGATKEIKIEGVYLRSYTNPNLKFGGEKDSLSYTFGKEKIESLSLFIVLNDNKTDTINFAVVAPKQPVQEENKTPQKILTKPEQVQKIENKDTTKIKNNEGKGTKSDKKENREKQNETVTKVDTTKKMHN